MRDLAAWLSILPVTLTRTPCFARATFSHEWEKDLGRCYPCDFVDRRADHVERDVSAADHQFVAKPEDR